MREDQWFGCYQESLKGMVTAASFAHPAKYAWELINRIYQHALEEGWVRTGDWVIDPMCGVAIGGIAAARHGLRFLGIELESRFYRFGAGHNCPGLTKAEWVRWYNRFERHPDLCETCIHEAPTWAVVKMGECQMSLWDAPTTGRAIPSRAPHRCSGNIDLHREALAAEGKPIPVMVQGDARNLQQLVHDAELICSSPPYADGCRGFGTDPHPDRAKGMEHSEAARQSASAFRNGYSQPSTVISSPPYAGQGEVLGTHNGIDYSKAHHGGKRATPARMASSENYGITTGQLGSMPEGNLQAIIASPPYVSGGHHPDQTNAWGGLATHKGLGTKDVAGYGQSHGQIGQLAEGDLQAIVTSPPWEKGAEGGLRQEKFKDAEGFAIEMHKRDQTLAARHAPSLSARLRQMERDRGKTYGEAEGNVGNLSQDTYWAAMHQIYTQAYQLLPVGGTIILVLKGFVRKGAYVDLPAQTAQLLTHVGFTVVHMHKAMLTSQVGQLTLDGGEERKSRKSFFRRLCEQKGAPEINFEIVLCARKERPC